MRDWLLYIIPATGVAGLVFAYYKASWIARQDAGTDRMKEIAGYVQEGAMAFLRREYKVLAVFVVAVAVLLGVSNAMGKSTPVAYRDPWIAGSFVLGALASALAGWFGQLAGIPDISFRILKGNYVLSPDSGCCHWLDKYRGHSGGW